MSSKYVTTTQKRPYIVVTGGCGYIGSHTIHELLKAYNVIVIDNLSNSTLKPLRRLEEMTGKIVHIVKTDIRDPDNYENVFKIFRPLAVIHFAGFKAVGESVADPLSYYDNNVRGTIALLEVMKKYDCKTMIFSSSATVYAPSNEVLTESSPLQPSNPYGKTKLMVEQILRDIYLSDSSWKIMVLRYFNPIGAHPSGNFGEDPNGIPNNLLPYITHVLAGKLPHLRIFGDDYNTKDGTGVRDYIHVVDLAAGHISALQKCEEMKEGCFDVYNLGTGNGYSVREIVEEMEKVSGKKIPVKICERRPGDIDIMFSSPEKAKKEMNWQVKYGLEDMCRDAWKWQSKNPNGYK